MRGKILIIDDSDHIRTSLGMFLEDLGFSVILTNNGTLALQLIRDNNPDLVLCDLVMPGISGLVVLQQAKKAFPQLKIVIMSGIEENGTLEEVKALGGETFLQKPLSLEYLQTEVVDKYFPK